MERTIWALKRFWISLACGVGTAVLMGLVEFFWHGTWNLLVVLGAFLTAYTMVGLTVISVLFALECVFVICELRREDKR